MKIKENKTNTLANLAPVQKNYRTWGLYAFFSCWVSMSVCIPAYQMASSAIALGLSWYESLLLVFIGNGIVLIPILLNSNIGIKYGISFPMHSMSVFGIRGAKIPLCLRTFIGAAWTGILMWVGAESLQIAMEALFEPWKNFKLGQIVCYIVFAFLNVIFTVSGPGLIKKLECYSVPIMLTFCFVLFVWSVNALRISGYNFWDAITCLESNKETDLKNTVLVFLVANISYYSTWAINISDLSCYAKNKKSHHIGVSLGLPFSMVLIAMFGIYITGVSKLVFGEPMWDPNDVVRAIGSKAGSVIAAIAIMIETLNTNVTTNILPPTNGLLGIFPKKLNFSKSVIITIVLATLIKPWEIVADPTGYIYDWLNTYGVVTGPVASILICDYYLVKKSVIDIDEFYMGTKSKYWYFKGFNIQALISWAIAVLPSAYSAIVMKNSFINDFGWIISFCLGFIIYYLIKSKKK